MAEEQITLESFDEAQQNFIKSEIAKATQAASKPDIDFTIASDFIRGQGGIIFAKEDDYKTKKLEAGRSIAANWETDARKKIKEITGAGWEESELLPDYAARAITSFEEKVKNNAGGKNFNAELETLKTKLGERESKITELTEKVNGFAEAQEKAAFKNAVSKAIEGKTFQFPTGATDEEKKDLFELYENKFYNWVNDTFEKGKDEQGTSYLKHKAKGDVSTNITELISKNLSESGLRFGNSQNGYQMPNGHSSMSDEAKIKALKDLESEMFAKGHTANTPEFYAEAITRNLKKLDDISKSRPNFAKKVKRLLQ